MSAIRPLPSARAPAWFRRLPVAAHLFLAMLSRLTGGRLSVYGPDGFHQEFGSAPGPFAQIEIRDWAVCGEIL
ncbi:MAG: SAM-dependent methyltransferase, partial [Betaproteobacteria bacterium]